MLTKMGSSILCWAIVLMGLVNGTIIRYSSACLEEERIALLHIKASFNFHPLLSWPDNKNSNCCEWTGIRCSNITMKVIEISVSYAQWGHKDLYFNASMFLSFKNLGALDLSGNKMAGWFNNEGFDKLSKLKNLEVLDLSYNNFNRSVLSSLSQLSSLKSLHLRGSYPLGSSTSEPSFERLIGLTNLEFLDISLNGGFNDRDVLSVLNLNDFTSLKHLDVSWNHFQTFGSINHGFNMPLELRNLEFFSSSGNLFNNNIFSSLKEFSLLKSLDLSYNNLKGTIFMEEFDALSNLEVLNLSGNEINDFQSLRGIRSTSHIRELQLNSMQSNSSKLLQSLQNVGFVTSLKVLSMSNCGLTGTLSQKDLCGFENIQELTFSNNYFQGMLPSCLANLTSLRLVDISSNWFTGNIAFSSLSKLTSLEYLFISENRLEIPISFESFANHSDLVVVYADGNIAVSEPECRAFFPLFQLQTFSMSNCTHLHRLPCFLHYQNKLRILDLSKNHMRGSFPTWLLENNTLDGLLLGGNAYVGSFNLPSHAQSSIRFIDLSQNQLSGRIPKNISSVFPNLRILKMGGNFLEGNIPSSIWSMKRLEALLLSNNKFSGELPTKLAIPPSLDQLQLNDNKFIGKLPEILSSSNYLMVLDLSNNSFSGMIPKSMGEMSGLFLFSLSHNQLQGHIPMELCNLVLLQLLDLSENIFSGSFPSCFYKLELLQHLFLHKNHFSGNLRDAIPNNSNLLTLDLSHNNFKGSIPQCIGNLSALNILLLRRNQFEGEIPNHLCHLQSLRMIDLSHNKLIGSIPRCLSNISLVMASSRYFLDLLQWRPVSTSNHRVESEVNPIEVKMKVEFTTKSSSLSYEGNPLLYMSGIDLSSNQLNGEIPIEFGNLSEIHVLNLSHNNLMGEIPKTFSNLHEIECIDLSYNNLSGRIPHELLELHALAAFSVAHNNLSGVIPELKGQFSTFDENSYEGNSFLCGAPLHINCSRTQFEHPFWSNNENEEEGGGFIDMEIFYISFSVSCPIFFLGVIITLCVNHYWRDRWFRFVENLVLSCYYFLVDRFSTICRM